ncbi:MAG: class I SAM-dependent methyltransferase [Planctomycetes bacterium]|nr:class I SAM-dependent methyltransferase [Planctomycetota bacterium]
MQPEQYPLMRAEEERHWWYRGNRSVVRALLGRFAPRGARLRLDAGCGTGKNLDAFADFGASFGIDCDGAAVRFSRERGCPRVARASVTALPFADASFDVVTCFEVLHSDSIADWQAVLGELSRVLRPDGVLVLREPAFMALFGSHDVVVHTARRFRRRPLRAAVSAAGLCVERCSYQNTVTFFPALAIRSFQRFRGLQGRTHVADFAKGDTVLGPLLAAWLRFEGWWLARARLPFGSSVLCVARKPRRGPT